MAEKSVNVFLTKSFWAPVMTMVVSKVALTIQDYVQLSEEEQTAIIGGLTAVVIALVRLITHRPAHLVKRKEGNENG